jgi:hypothetical protein
VTATSLDAVLAHGDQIADNGIDTITLTDTQFATFIGTYTADPLTADKVTLGAVTGNEGTVIANVAKIAANGITSITLSDAQAATAGFLADAAVAAGAETIGAVDASKALVLANAAKIAADGITSITLTEAELTTNVTLTAGAGPAINEDAFADNSISVGAVTDGSNAEATLLASGCLIADGGITSITLTAGPSAPRSSSVFATTTGPHGPPCRSSWVTRSMSRKSMARPSGLPNASTPSRGPSIVGVRTCVWHIS